jgi:anti-sigma regulatory factor (Ser/Thr protein kinase)
VIHHIAVSSQAPAIARSIVGEDLPPTIDSGKLADAQLVASELAQNVVRHSSSGPDEEFSLEVQTDADRIRIIVVDDGSGFSRDELLPASEDPWSGEGLRLVDAIASRWGADRSAGGGTIAWAEIDA